MRNELVATLAECPIGLERGHRASGLLRQA